MLQVIADHSRDNGAEKHSWGKLLFSSQLAAPNVSFLAHLYGVLAGHVRVHLLPPGGLSTIIWLDSTAAAAVHLTASAAAGCWLVLCVAWNDGMSHTISVPNTQALD